MPSVASRTQQGAQDGRLCCYLNSLYHFLTDCRNEKGEESGNVFEK